MTRSIAQRRAARSRWIAAACWAWATCCGDGKAHAQPIAGPPTAIVTHSALPEDVRPDVAPARLSRLRLPAVDDGSGPRIAPTGYELPTPDEWPARLEPPPPAPPLSWRPTYVPPGAKSGALQQALLRATYLPRLENDSGFGMTDVVKQFTFALPPFVYGSPILVTPGLTMHFLDGPGSLDLPNDVHTIELEFRYLKQLGPRWGIDVAAAPSYYGDFANDSSDAWRVTGRALAAWDWTPTTKLVFGTVILGRDDFFAVPAVGAILTPAPEIRAELIIPRPRLKYRLADDGIAAHWAYLGGEFGGNTWAIDRTGGIADKFTYSDLRLVVGYERAAVRGLSARAEAGWVFDREIEYRSGIPGFSPADTFMLRGEVSY